MRTQIANSVLVILAVVSMTGCSNSNSNTPGLAENDTIESSSNASRYATSTGDSKSGIEVALDDTNTNVQTEGRIMDGLNSISLSANGRQAITGTPESVAILWDVSKGLRSHVLVGHDGPVVAVSLTADGKRAITGSYDKTAILWG